MQATDEGIQGEQPCNQLTWPLEPVICASRGVEVWGGSQERALKTWITGQASDEGVRPAPFTFLRGVVTGSILLAFSSLEPYQLPGVGQARMAASFQPYKKY